MSFKFASVDTSPTPTVPAAKDVQAKAVKLTFADFTTGGTAAIKAVLPNDASIVRISVWTKTTFSGGTVSALSLSIGVTGTATKFVNAGTVNLTGGNNATFNLTAGTGGFQEFDPTSPNTDMALLFTGTATTGNPTAGEAYVLIEYVR